MEKKAYAKLNLTLEIGDKRPDGYHSLTSVMARATLFDTVRVEKNSLGSIRFSSTSDIPTEDNLCTRAVGAYFDAGGIVGQGVDIYVEANIPTASGMGGGSADSAATLLCMEELFGALDKRVRHEIARGLGADVPYCLETVPCFCTGVGDVCERIECKGFENLWLVIEKCGTKLSTGKVFSDFDSLEKANLSHDHEKVISAFRTGEVEMLAEGVFNDFEAVVLPSSPSVLKKRNELLDMGALNVVMSGAGPTVVGLFDDEKKARACSDKVYKLLV